MTAVDLNLGGDRATTSACEASDFAGFPRGDIALVQRGTCQFAAKVDHAVAAGASGVVVLNQGDDPGRLGLFAGTLGRQASVPVVATTFDLGAEWAATPGTTLTLAVESTVTRVTTENLIADTPTGAAERTVVVGAHLDGVAEGPGINDNGSGVAAVLETAVRFAELGVQPHNRVRFAFWGAEEDGLHGSEHYVAQLDDAGRRGTARYLNLDMVGSPKPVASVYGGGAPGSGWPAGSGAIQTVLTDFLTSQGVTPADGQLPRQRPRVLHRRRDPRRWAVHRRGGRRRPVLPPGLRPRRDHRPRHARPHGRRRRPRHAHLRPVAGLAAPHRTRIAGAGSSGIDLADAPSAQTISLLPGAGSRRQP